MSVTPTDYLTAIAQLPAGGALCLNDVGWEEYENLLADLGESYAVRIFYDSGTMEIMAPASAHERPKSCINRLITALGDELDIDVELWAPQLLSWRSRPKELNQTTVSTSRVLPSLSVKKILI